MRIRIPTIKMDFSTYFIIFNLYIIQFYKNRYTHEGLGKIIISIFIFTLNTK